MKKIKSIEEKISTFLLDLHKDEKQHQLEMVKRGDIDAEDFGSDEEIYDHMIDWLVEDMRNLKFDFVSKLRF